MTSTPTRPVDNVVITTKGLQDRNIHILDGRTVENKGKLILTKTEIRKIKEITTLATREKDAFLGLVEEIKVIQGLNMLMRHLHKRINQLSKNINMLIDLLIQAQPKV